MSRAIMLLHKINLKLAKDVTICVFALFEPELLESKTNTRVKNLNIHFQKSMLSFLSIF